MSGIPRIGIFGGTFDPPHLGHLILAGEAMDQVQLTRLLWVLTPNPPHKQEQPITALEHRMAMLEGMLGNFPEFELSKVEINRPGPHFSADTVQLISRAHPEAEIVYLMGGDSLRDLPLWDRPTTLIAACHLIGVMRRPGDVVNLDRLESVLPGLKAKVRFIDAPQLDIASRDLRKRISEGKTFRYYLHPNVYDYIQQHHLYR